MRLKELEQSNRRTKIMFYMATQGFDTKDMARLLGISRQSFSYIINNKVDVRLSRLIKIAEILKVDVKTII
jgi:transcriptional regulator with XRE-family HTH domain